MLPPRLTDLQIIPAIEFIPTVVVLIPSVSGSLIWCARLRYDGEFAPEKAS